MTLIDQYNTLLARGMPEHPRLQWGFWHGAWRWLIEANGGDLCPLDSEGDARDLIEAHAMRWLESAPEIMPDCEVTMASCWAFERWSVTDNSRHDLQGCPLEFKAATALAAIIAATEVQDD